MGTDINILKTAGSSGTASLLLERKCWAMRWSEAKKMF